MVWDQEENYGQSVDQGGNKVQNVNYGRKLGLECDIGRKTRFRVWIRGENQVQSVDQRRKLGLKCGLEEKTRFRVWIRGENQVQIGDQGDKLGCGEIMLPQKSVFYSPLNPFIQFQTIASTPLVLVIFLHTEQLEGTLFHGLNRKQQLVGTLFHALNRKQQQFVGNIVSWTKQEIVVVCGNIVPWTKQEIVVGGNIVPCTK